MTGVVQLPDSLEFFFDRLSPAGRRKLLVQVRLFLVRANKSRMAAETDPDGVEWEERKVPSRRSRRKMMTGLRKKLRATSNSEEVEVGWRGRAADIAKIHHLGLMASVSADGPRVQYAMRELIGITDGDFDQIEEILLSYIDG